MNMWSPVEKCWVPTCSNSKEQGYKKNFFPLPSSLKFKEIWLSLAGRKSAGLQEEIYFCQDHFNPTSVETYMEKFVCLSATAIPYYNMPERICRTCMTTIMESQVFCVLSANVPSAIPPDIKSEVLTCRPEPLLQLLSFCVPELSLYQDPPPLVCFKCHHSIWLFYIYKLTCNAVEKELRGNLSTVEFGKMVLCRSCPTTSGTSFFGLKEDSSVGSLLKKMFLSNYPSDVVPLKVCLKCWNILYKLERFYLQCLSVEEKLQRHMTLSQIGLNSGLLPKPQTLIPTNPLREYRRITHPYQKIAPTTVTSAVSLGNVKTDNKFGPTASTSVVKLSEPQELKCNPVIPTVQNSNIRGLPQVPNSVQQNIKQISADGIVKNIIEDEPLKKRDLEQPVQTNSLTSVEEVMLAGLMLKYGQQLKFEGSAKQHFEAWVNVIRHFHQLGYDRSLEMIQSSWNCMRSRAKLAFASIGPATYIEQLVIDYLIGYQSNISLQANSESNNAKETKNCDIICIDDDEINSTTDKAVEVAPAALPESSETAKTATTCHGKEKVEKKPMKAKRGRKKKAQTKDYWNRDHNLKLVQSMRKEYDRCLQHNDLAPGRSPWQMIIKRLIEKEYTNFSFEKLYSVWGKLRMSATIHEKNGLDIVDDEVWDMLQVQNAVQKNVIGKSRSNSKVSDKKTSVVTEENSNESSSEQNVTKSNDRNLRSQHSNTLITNELITYRDDSDSDYDYNPRSSKKKKVDQKLPKGKNNEKGDTSHDPASSKRAHHSWSADEKMEAFKLIKQQFNLMLKNRESLRSPWHKIVERIYSNGYNKVPLKSFYATWCGMRRIAASHENDGKRSILDDKILRLLKLYNRLKNLQSVPQKKAQSPPQKKAQLAVPEVPKEAETTETINKKKCDDSAETTNQKKRGDIAETTNQKKSDDIAETTNQEDCDDVAETTNQEDCDDIAETTNQEESDDDEAPQPNDEKSPRWPHQQKLDLLSIIASYGGEVFKKADHPTRHAFWSKVTTDFHAKGYKDSVLRVRHVWFRTLSSAKRAWADQQRVSALNKVVIEFMTEVIQKNKKQDETSTENDNRDEDHVDEDDNGDKIFENDSRDKDHEDEDDKCDKTSGMSDATNKSPTPTNDEDGTDINYDYVSLEDIEKNYGVDIVGVKREQVGEDETEEPLLCKIESYTSEQIVEILDSEED